MLEPNAAPVGLSRAEFFVVSLAAAITNAPPAKTLKDLGLEGACRRIAPYIALSLERGRVADFVMVVSQAIAADDTQARALVQDSLRREIEERYASELKAATDNRFIIPVVVGVLGLCLGLLLGQL
jgi:hypothetical protein